MRQDSQRFDQRPYVQKGGAPVAPLKVAMADAGYLYVPPDCAAGQSCRLHVAFHGCQQQAERVGTAFVTKAGFNEWADANRIVVLYPQAKATSAPPLTPLNPQGCWDWWGYNDFSFDMPGHYATKEGLQIAAVWRMAQRLAGGASGGAQAAGPSAGVPQVTVADASAQQVALSWKPVAGAAGYVVYRNGQRVNGTVVDAPLVVDSAVAPASRYAYTVRSVDQSGGEGAASGPVTAATAPMPRDCDPYFSLLQNRPVTRKNRPTGRTCP